MTALLIFPILWIVTAAGRALCNLIGLPADATRLERTLISLAYGLGLLAYGTLAIGLAGFLTLPAIVALLVLLGLAGTAQHIPMARGFAGAFRQFKGFDATTACALTFGALCLAIALIGCFTPPTQLISPTEWDSIAYHLADPKIYLRAHRIIYIPWESHSNFAFSAEMWYTIALLFNSVPLAKLFHLTCGIGVCLATYAIGLRHFGRNTGLLAAVLVAGTAPMLAEAGTAYVDLAAAFYLTLTLLALLNGVRERNYAPGQDAKGSTNFAHRQDAKGSTNWRWIMPAGAILMGFTLSFKALALTSFALFAAALLYALIICERRPLWTGVRQVCLWCLAALAVGCPWYVKSYVYTGDPVFPFGWSLFKNSHWSQVNAEQYKQSNLAFGLGHRPVDLFFAPWNATMYPLPNHPVQSYLYWVNPGSISIIIKQSFNDLPTVLIALPAIFLVGFMALPFLRANNLVRALTLYTALTFLFWFASMQYVRYLLPLVPALALLTAWVIVKLMESRRFSGIALSILAGVSVLFTLLNGLLLTRDEFRVATGMESQSHFLSRTFPGYGAITWLNTQTAPDATIAFYGEPLGYYSDRNYFWADSEHSTYVPYSQFHTATDLQNWLNAHHVGYILVNTTAFGMTGKSGDYSDWVYDLTEGAGSPVYFSKGIGIWKTPGS